MDVFISGSKPIILTTYLMQYSSDIDYQNPAVQFKELEKKLRSDLINTEAEIKPSAFNFHIETRDKFLIYNTLYNSMARFTKREFAKLCGQQKCGRELRKRFLTMGFAVAVELDEKYNYQKWRQIVQKNSQYLSINITTTLRCNARCQYCYEQGVAFVDFDESLIESLIKFIDCRKKKTPVKLNWFGGEPFMNPKIIDAVTKRLDEGGTNFESFVITNGSLITKKLISQKFKKWHIKGIQITLDGTTEEYEKRKNYIGNVKNIFTSVLDNIENVAANGVHVDIRLNIDRKNLSDMKNLIYILQERFDDNDNVVYYPAFVTGVKDKLTEEEKISFIKDLFVELSNPSKMNINERLYSFPRIMACMRNDPQSFSVDVYGRVYNCEHLVGRKDSSLGTLKRLSQEVNESRRNEPLRKECEECVFLPKCMGGCASNLRTGDPACMIEKYIIQAYMQYMAE